MSDASLTQDEQVAEKTVELIGITEKLDGDRSVYLGRPTNKDDDSWYMRFANNGEETPLRLSGEAMQLLMQMYVVHLRQEAGVGTWKLAVVPDADQTGEGFQP